MRRAPIGFLSDYFVSYDDAKGRYTEVNFELKRDAVAFIKRLEKRGVESAELWTRKRVHEDA